MTLETKRFAIDEMKATEADDGTRTVEGFGSVFGNTDSYGEVVMPGAFADTLKARMPAMLWQHKSDTPIGVWDEAEETKKGLRLKGRILPTQQGNDAYLLAKAGALTGLSIGFTTTKDERDPKKGVRRLLALDLYEVSLVTFPANDRATITNVKADDGTLMTEREFEEFLRDAGRLSHKEAKIVVSGGYKALLNHRDGEAAGLSRLSDLFNQFKL